MLSPMISGGGRLTFSSIPLFTSSDSLDNLSKSPFSYQLTNINNYLGVIVEIKEKCKWKYFLIIKCYPDIR